MKKTISLSLAACLATALFPLTACNTQNQSTQNENILRVASWDEYIDEGGSFYDESDPDWSLIAEKANVALESARSLFSLTEGHRVRCEAGGNEEIVPQLNAMISTLAAFDECYEGFKELLCLADLSLEEDWFASHENLCEYILEDEVLLVR